MSKEEIEKVRQKVEKMYKNYGIDIFDMSDDELNRVCRHYLKNSDDLKSDFAASKEHAKSADE